MMTKSEKAKRLFSSGKIKEALRIFKTFKRTFNSEEKRIIEIAYECMSGNGAFYQSLCIDNEQVKSQALLIIQQKFFTKRV